MTVRTLRLWLAGPMQSWGTASRFEVRTTDLWPSKSGVIGLLAAALGRSRETPVDDLAALRFGVRVERPGSVLRDFHTVGAGISAKGVAVSSGARGRGIVTERYYLQDAAFVAGLEGEDEQLMRTLLQAVAAPRWPLALGRRSCPPAGPVVDDGALVDIGLHAALSQPWRPAGGTSWAEPAVPADVRLVLEDPEGDVELHDQPVGAAFARRTFTSRRVRFVSPLEVA